MLELLKRMAMQQLMQKMAGNSLGAAETQNAAEGSANGLMGVFQNALGGEGGPSQLQDLLSNNENTSESNPLFAGIKDKIQESLQAQGMSAEEASTEAAATAPNVIDAMKEKFASEAPEDKGFDFAQLAQIATGGGLGNVGGIIDAAKNILGK